RGRPRSRPQAGARRQPAQQRATRGAGPSRRRTLVAPPAGVDTAPDGDGRPVRALALTRRGLRRAGREWRLALLLWLTHLVVAAVALAPVAAALLAALGAAP